MVWRRKRSTPTHKVSSPTVAKSRSANATNTTTTVATYYSRRIVAKYIGCNSIAPSYNANNTTVGSIHIVGILVAGNKYQDNVASMSIDSCLPRGIRTPAIAT